MRKVLLLIAGVIGITVAPALAGPVETALPANPCPTPNGNLKLALIANGVMTDSNGPACGVGGGCVETMVVCYHTGRTGSKPMDVAIELFDNGGTLIPGIASACGVQPGNTADFVTQGMQTVWALVAGGVGTLPPPYYANNLITAGPLVPPGSLRILSSIPGKVACDVTGIDVTMSISPLMPLPTGSTAGVTVTKKTGRQKGD